MANFATVNLPVNLKLIHIYEYERACHLEYRPQHKKEHLFALLNNTIKLVGSQIKSNSLIYGHLNVSIQDIKHKPTQLPVRERKREREEILPATNKFKE